MSSLPEDEDEIDLSDPVVCRMLDSEDGIRIKGFNGKPAILHPDGTVTEDVS